ncbi:MAG: alpha/beta hydrolase [Planctomycetaceae bacterium]|nr:alpha/beta hydrolase [Planctomycetaceae bacterium]
MSVRTQIIVSLALLFLLVAGNQSLFAQIRPPTRQDAMNSRTNAFVRQQDRRAEEERERMAWENEQRRRMEAEEAARLAEIRNRPKTDRKTHPGFQSPTELNKALDALRPGDSIELHGDLFTAFDGMILSATYYRGAAGKESVPIVLLNGLGGSRRDFDPILSALLKEGMAVLVPDIRGHGKSVEFIVEEFGNPFPRYHPDFPIEAIPENPFANTWLPARWAEYQRMSADLEAGRLQNKPPTLINAQRIDKYDGRDFALMVYDLQVWQNFLANENNQERLNIRKLNLVGTEMGAGLAVHWCRHDQAGAKQTKTLTLISPVIPADAMEAKKGNGMNLAHLNNNAMKNSLYTMIIVGENNKRALEDAKKVKTVLLGKGVDNESGINAKYPLILCNTERQGRDLFALTSARIDQGIPAFIGDRLKKLEAAAAEKKNDKSLVWTAGNWNKKVTPQPPKEK